MPLMFLRRNFQRHSHSLTMHHLIVSAVKRMNVRPGGKQSVMRDTIFNGKMVLPDGRPKGMKIILCSKD